MRRLVDELLDVCREYKKQDSEILVKLTYDKIILLLKEAAYTKGKCGITLDVLTKIVNELAELLVDDGYSVMYVTNTDFSNPDIQKISVLPTDSIKNLMLEEMCVKTRPRPKTGTMEQRLF